MNLIFIEKFNNYYNRRLKRFTTIDEYITGRKYQVVDRVSFNFNDGVNTQVILNALNLSFIPDYVLVQEELDKSIVSRWFVMEALRTRRGQYKIELRRDLLADYYDLVKTAPIAVRRGNLSKSNPLIYLPEGNTYNQIKSEELLLQDFTKKAWIVGYISNDVITAENNNISFDPTDDIPILESLSLKYNTPGDPTAGVRCQTITKSKFYYRYKHKVFSTDLGNSNLGITLKYKNESDFSFGDEVIGPGPLQFTYYNIRTPRPTGEYPSLGSALIQPYKDNFDDLSLGIREHIESSIGDTADRYEYNFIKSLNGKVVKSSQTNKYYILQLGSTVRKNFNTNINSNDTPADVRFCQAAKTLIRQANQDYPKAIIDIQEEALNDYSCEMEYEYINITLGEVENPDETWNLTISPLHNTLLDSPYSMFAIPFSLENMKLANEISKKYGGPSGGVYDIQILPFCPATELLDEETAEPIATEEKDITFVTSGEEETVVSYILWSTTSSKYLTINLPIPLEAIDAVDLKVENETKMYRLVSPNYSGAFEFSLAKNDGVDFFEVAYTYKPYTPYIQVNPNFKNLYGSDFNDERGLICSGNFSIATITDAFQQYEIQNKNYENIFNQSIKKMDIEFGLSMAQTATSGLIRGASGIAGVGLGINDPTKMGLGMTGSIVSDIAGAAFSAARYDNNRRLAIENYNLNLQNVQARPDSLNKVSAYCITNKYFPFIEIYKATDVEVSALRNKIKYEAMNVGGAIYTIEDFVDVNNDYNFFAGSLIICEELAEDYHLLQALKDELDRGFYI